MGLKFSTVIDTRFRFIYFRFRRFPSGTKWYRKCSMDRPCTRCRKKIRYFFRDFNICNKYTGTSFMDSITGKTRIWNLGEYFDHCKCYSTGSKCFSVSPKLPSWGCYGFCRDCNGGTWVSSVHHVRLGARTSRWFNDGSSSSKWHTCRPRSTWH